MGKEVVFSRQRLQSIFYKMFKEFKETMAKRLKENVLTDSNIRNLKK